MPVNDFSAHRNYQLPHRGAPSAKDDVDRIRAALLAIDTDVDGLLDSIDAIEAALDDKAGLDSPIFLNNPTAPTQPQSDNSQRLATTGFVKTAFADLVGSSPETLNQINELADALGDDANFAATMATALAAKADAAATTAALAAKASVAPVRGAFYKADAGSVAFTKTGAGTVSIKALSVVNVADTIVSFSADTAVTMPSLTAGTDYAIYVCTDGSIRADASFTAPSGYTVNNSRQIGGFHYAPGGNAAAQAGGNTTPSINEYSLWDLKWRPACSDPRGMTLVGGAFWCDIYLLGVDHHLNGTSKYNLTIADGSSPPKVPTAFGGNGSAVYGGLTWWQANECLQAAGKDLLSVGEFGAAAYGTTEASSAVTDPVSTVLRGASTSKWGVMLATGNLWQWSRDWNMRWDGTGGWANRSNAEGRGSQYISGTVNLCAAILGGNWANGADSGSRASDWSSCPWASSGNIGARGRCDHLRLV